MQQQASKCSSKQQASKQQHASNSKQATASSTTHDCTLALQSWGKQPNADAAANAKARAFN
jgi:hypothetical protein